jgi:hypothetical protein
MNAITVETSRAARTAGIAYVLIILMGVFSENIINSRLVSPDNISDTIASIRSNEVLFRVGVVTELVMYVLVIALSISLYVLLKNIDRNLALTALLFRFGEAIVGIGITTMSGFVSLLLLNSDIDQPSLVQLFLNVSDVGLDVVLALVGIGGILFCYLFFKSRYIPRLLAAWGIFTYATMLLLGLVSILMPNLPTYIKMALFIPGGIFELAIGIWLLTRGVSVQYWQGIAPASS